MSNLPDGDYEVETIICLEYGGAWLRRHQQKPRPSQRERWFNSIAFCKPNRRS